MTDINRIREYCKREDVTVNAYIAAAFALAYKSYTAGEEARFVCIKEDGELSVDLLCEPDSTVSSFVSSCKDLTGTRFSAEDISFEYSIGDGIEIRCESSSYDEYTIKGFLRTFDNMAEDIAKKERLSDVCGTKEDDEKAIKGLYDSYYPVKERPAYRLLEDSCAKYPERKALVACDRTLTF